MEAGSLQERPVHAVGAELAIRCHGQDHILEVQPMRRGVPDVGVLQIAVGHDVQGIVAESLDDQARPDGVGRLPLPPVELDVVEAELRSGHGHDIELRLPHWP